MSSVLGERDLGLVTQNSFLEFPQLEIEAWFFSFDFLLCSNTYVISECWQPWPLTMKKSWREVHTMTEAVTETKKKKEYEDRLQISDAA